MKFWKLVIIATVVMISISANAALIENGSYTTDTETRLDWLDLSITDNQSYVVAATLNPEWRYATNSEVENLFGQLFDGYYDTHQFNYSSSNDGAVYSDQESDVNNFISLFGETKANDFNIISLGFYEDEDDVLRWIGVTKDIGDTPSTLVYGLESSFGAEVYREDFNNNSAGVLMVRASIVPVPAAFWLFTSGLVGLVGFIRRKKS